MGGDVGVGVEEAVGAEEGEGWVVVDIGGGRGDLAVNIARLLPQVEVHMVDVNPLSLDAARQSAKGHGEDVFSRCHFRQEDVTQLLSAPSLLCHTTNAGAIDFMDAPTPPKHTPQPPEKCCAGGFTCLWRIDRRYSSAVTQT